jgi:nucleoside-diphosphate-sugar epimerase
MTHAARRSLRVCVRVPQQGGAGFIGSHATLRLLLDGHTVTIVVRARAAPKAPRHTRGRAAHAPHTAQR